MHIVLISLHGLIRGHDLELGRDADTGGQTRYVVEMARALAASRRVHRVTLLTRWIGAGVSRDYMHYIEPLGQKAEIVRFPCGPVEYLPKEELWEHLDEFTTNALRWMYSLPVPPAVIHSHYADAGYIGMKLSEATGVPHLHTAHSLGRPKRARLLAAGWEKEDIESRYRLKTRVAIEESILRSADRIIASAQSEIDTDYSRYDGFDPRRATVIPPGVDLSRFGPPDGTEWSSPIAGTLQRFLRNPDLPMVLAIARPDERKNLGALVDAFGSDPGMTKLGNLVIIAGNRDNLDNPVITDIVRRIDHHDLYGHVAYPKHHDADDIPDLYRLAAASRGVFVNPALVEPFGLTLLEAAASGLPVVATKHGGPVEILARCQHGILVEPSSASELRDAITRLLDDRELWKACSANGIANAKRHYSWSGFVRRYLATLIRLGRTHATTPAVQRSRRHADTGRANV